MYTVKWIEDNKEQSKSFEERDDAFRFQSGLIAKKINEKKNIETKGIWD